LTLTLGRFTISVRVKWQMRKLVPFVITAVLLALAVGTVPALTPIAVAQQTKVGAQFSTYLIYDSPKDVFTNGEVTGRKEWHANIGSRVPLTGLALTLNSTLNFDHIMKENLTTDGPPSYVWSVFPPGTGREVYVGFGSLDSPGVVPVTFTPGFDASRSADKTVFTAPDNQTLTITVTPREEGLEKLSVCVIADEEDLIDPIISSYSSTTDAESIKLTADSHRLALDHIPVKLNPPLTITITLQVTPKVPLVSYKPRINFIPERQMEADSGTVIGSSVSYTMPEVGTWTVSARRRICLELGGRPWDK